MTSDDFFNPHGAGTEPHGRDSDDDLAKPRKHLMQGLLAAGAYALWGASDAMQAAEIYGVPEAGPADALFRIALVGGLAAFMFFKKSMIGVGGLIALTLMNSLGLLMLWLEGDPYSDVGATVLHLAFGAMFVRTAFAVRKIKSAQ